MEKLSPKDRPSRTKSYPVWEKLNIESNGLYGEYFRILAQRFNELTRMELFVAVLIKAGLKSWEIGQKLCIEEKTVENHRNSIHRKLQIRGINLTVFFAAV